VGGGGERGVAGAMGGRGERRRDGVLGKPSSAVIKIREEHPPPMIDLETWKRPHGEHATPESGLKKVLLRGSKSSGGSKSKVC